MTYIVSNKQDFEQELENAGDNLVVIDFYANWCGPCKIIEPHLEELSRQHKDKAKFLKVNIDDCEDIAMKYNITSMPTFIFMKNRKILDILVGGNVENLVKNVEKHVGGKTTVKKLKASDHEDADLLVDDGYELDNELDNDDMQDPATVLQVLVED